LFVLDKFPNATFSSKPTEKKGEKSQDTVEDVVGQHDLDSAAESDSADEEKDEPEDIDEGSFEGYALNTESNAHQAASLG
jgi:hypothetical protein